MKNFAVLTNLPARYIKYLRYQVRPLWSTFAVTENCNGRCEYCQYWKKKHQQLSTEEIFKVIQGIKQLGILSVSLSGGECLLRKDIVDIVAYLTKLGIRVSLTTNGLISNDTLYHDLMKQGVSTFAFSLDGSTAPVHEAFRKGCIFEKLIASIERAVAIKSKYRFPTSIVTTTVVNRKNINNLKNIYALRKQLGADGNYFQPIWPIFGEEGFHEQFGFSDFDKNKLQEIAKDLQGIPDGNLKQYYKLFPHLYRNFAHITNKYECYAGRAFVYIDSSGRLFPCSPLTDQPMGSLLGESTQSIISHPELKKKLKSYSKYKCGVCTMSCYIEKNIVLSSLHTPFSLWKRLK